MKYCAVVLVCIACVLSCKKKKNDNPFGNVRINTIDMLRDGETLHSTVYYDNFGNVDSILSFGSGITHFLKFAYFGTSYSVTNEFGSAFTVEDDGAGRILQIQLPDTLIMKYSGAQLTEIDTKSPSATYPFYEISQSFLTWAGGDVSVVGSQSYDYDLAHSGQPADAIRSAQFLAYGRSYIKTTHLPIDLRNSAKDTAEKYFYQFDGQGRISQFVRLMKVATAIYDTTVFTYGY